jgi:hypothetical protein
MGLLLLSILRSSRAVKVTAVGTPSGYLAEDKLLMKSSHIALMILEVQSKLDVIKDKALCALLEVLPSLSLVLMGTTTNGC